MLTQSNLSLVTKIGKILEKSKIGHAEKIEILTMCLSPLIVLLGDYDMENIVEIIEKINKEIMADSLYIVDLPKRILV